MKKLYMIGGAMGVGKTAVSQRLKVNLPNSVFLDGDWCWDMNPFQVTEETKAMVLDNICCLLNRYLRCSLYENIIFCWVMHRQEIIDTILSRLELGDCAVKTVSLVCGRDELIRRLSRDVEAGLRTEDVIGRSLDRLPCYEGLDTVKIDVSQISPGQAAERIMGL